MLLISKTCYAGVDFSMISQRTEDLKKEKILEMVIEEHVKRKYKEYEYKNDIKKDRRGASQHTYSIPIRIKK